MLEYDFVLINLGVHYGSLSIYQLSIKFSLERCSSVCLAIGNRVFGRLLM